MSGAFVVSASGVPDGDLAESIFPGATCCDGGLSLPQGFKAAVFVYRNYVRSGGCPADHLVRRFGRVDSCRKDCLISLLEGYFRLVESHALGRYDDFDDT